MAGKWLVCPNCEIIFPQPRPDRYTGCCSRSCAREWEAKQRRPSLDAEIDRVLLGFGEELKRVLRRR